MNTNLKISTRELRIIFSKLLDHLEKQGDEIALPHDFYWNIEEESLYEVSVEPKKFTIGQLTDDWKELKKLLDSDGEPIAFSFVWLAAILRALGEEVVS